MSILAKDNQKLSKGLSKGSETSVYWNKCKRKSEMKNTTNEYKYFRDSDFSFIQIQIQKGIEPKGII